MLRQHSSAQTGGGSGGKPGRNKGADGWGGGGLQKNIGPLPVTFAKWNTTLRAKIRKINIILNRKGL
jgi:hypothetical protein